MEEIIALVIILITVYVHSAWSRRGVSICSNSLLHFGLGPTTIYRLFIDSCLVCRYRLPWAHDEGVTRLQELDEKVGLGYLAQLSVL